MILVTVGMHSSGFNRLIRPVDALAAQIEEPVIIQRGVSTYLPLHGQHFRFATMSRMIELTRAARVVICHAAAGSIIVSLRQHKPLVIVPRLKRYDEHFDDHQLQLARAVDAAGAGVAVFQPSIMTLRAALHASANLVPRGMTGPDRLVCALRGVLDGEGFV